MLPDPDWTNVTFGCGGEAVVASHLVLWLFPIYKEHFHASPLRFSFIRSALSAQHSIFFKKQEHIHSINKVSTMKAFTISTFLVLLATELHAAPSSNARQFEAQLTFEGAPPDVAFYKLSVPTDSSIFTICMSSAPSPGQIPLPRR